MNKEFLFKEVNSACLFVEFFFTFLSFRSDALKVQQRLRKDVCLLDVRKRDLYYELRVGESRGDLVDDLDSELLLLLLAQIGFVPDPGVERGFDVCLKGNLRNSESVVADPLLEGKDLGFHRRNLVGHVVERAGDGDDVVHLGEMGDALVDKGFVAIARGLEHVPDDGIPAVSVWLWTYLSRTWSTTPCLAPPAYQM